MALTTGRDLKRDVLFRASENSLGQSDWDLKVMDYLNRSYREVANGSSQFLPEFIDDWWWMHRDGVLLLEATYKEGSIAVTRGSTAAVLSAAPDFSLTGYRMRIVGQPDIFIVESHTALTADVTLDIAYTGDTDSIASFEAMKTDYELDPAVVSSVMSPIKHYHGPDMIGMTPERLSQLYPISRLGWGVPSAYALLDETTIRFNRGGLEDQKMRVEYHYKPVVAALEDSDTSIPLIPIQFRQVLSDMALSMVLVDKNDDRATVAMGAAKALLTAMVRENRRKLAKISNSVGTIYPRASGQRRRHEVLTVSGHRIL